MKKSLYNLKRVIMNEEMSIDLKQRFKRIVEALLFATPQPLALSKIREICQEIAPLTTKELRSLIDELQEEYSEQERVFCIFEVDECFILKSHERYAEFIVKLGRNKRQDKITPACAEVLAIVAFKQPVTRAQIESIRGVDCSSLITQLMERELIESAGTLEAPGRPTLYSTSKQFLNHFGLKDLSDFPKTMVREN